MRLVYITDHESLTDILKEVPLSLVLREKISALETENSLLKDENASLKDDLREARARITKLETQIESLAAKPALEDIEIQLVRILAERVAIEEPAVPHALNVSHSKAMHHLAQLKNHGYARPTKGFPFPSWRLTEKGLAFANENNLTNRVVCSWRRRTTNRWTANTCSINNSGRFVHVSKTLHRCNQTRP